MRLASHEVTIDAPADVVWAHDFKACPRTASDRRFCWSAACTVDHTLVIIFRCCGPSAALVWHVRGTLGHDTAGYDAAVSDELIKAHNRITVGLHEAWTHLATRYPRHQLDRQRVVHTPGPYEPRYDPEVERIYRTAQGALTFAYDRAVAAGVPSFWSGRSTQADRVVDPEILISVSCALVRRADQAGDPERLTFDLATVAHQLRAFWRPVGTVVNMCTSCGEHPRPKRRRTCWRCTNGRRRTKTVTSR